MFTAYQCQICKTKPDQISHHKSHLTTQKHKDKKSIFELKLKELTEEDLQQQYHKTQIEDIIKEYENMVVQQVEVVEELPVVVENQEIEKEYGGEVLWTIENNQEENMEYSQQKEKLESIIKQCHQLLYNEASVVGIKAQNDIMRVLCIKILQPYFNNQEWVNKLQIKAEQQGMIMTKFHEYLSYCQDFENFLKLQIYKDLAHIWKFFNKDFLARLLNGIYEIDEDQNFNFGKNSNLLIKLIQKINTLEITQEFKDAFSTTCGDIHESFRKYGGGKGAKELGQYFTPRNLIHLIFHGLKIDTYLENKEEPIKIYDPCMGTGGFLTRLYKLGNILPENIYGCETESDTIKFGMMSVVLTAQNIDNHIIKCNSLSQDNKFMMDNVKFDCIITNPPFGTKMNYKNLQKTFEDKYPDKKFKDIYPLPYNNGACLFVQHCVYMLKEKGVCAIVLPDGELFEGSSKWSIKFRKWLSDSVNIKSILKVQSGTFEHASVKTNVIIFTKDGKTENIQFLETNKECTQIKDIFTISYQELENKDYSLSIMEYLKQEENEYNNYNHIKLNNLLVKCNNLININENETYKLIKMSSNKIPTINKIIKGKDIKYNKMQLIENDTFIMSKILNYCHGFSNDNIINGVLSTEFWIFKLNNISAKYFEYIYKYVIINKLKNISSGSSIRRINYKDFMDLEIPIPSLETQQKIVEELDIIYQNINTIEERKQQLKKEKDLYHKYGKSQEIKELLKNSEEKMIQDICEINYGNKNEIHTETENIYPSISGGSKISKYTNQWNIPENTILIARSGSCGSVNMFPQKCLMGSYGFFLRIISNNNINHVYLFNYLKFNQSDLENMSKGATVKNLNRDTLYKYHIPIPSLENQEKCIKIYQEKEEYINLLENKIETETKYIEELKELGKDIIQYYC